MSEAKKAKTAETYHLVYHKGTPGRGEHIRLALEDAGASYTEAADQDEVLSYFSADSTAAGSPPPFAPPVLKAGDAVISQTPNILLFLGPRLGLVPDDEVGRLHVNALALTALDLNNEAHDTHHPVGVMLYYEDQKDEAKRAAAQFREGRVPKYFGYFERVLKANGAGGSEWLVGERATYADLVLWQVVDGLLFAFPKAATKQLEKHELLKAHYGRVKARPRIKSYLESDRRQKYSMGIFRHYPELDDEE